MKTFKPLLNYNGKSFLMTIIDKLSPVCESIFVVTGYNKKMIEEHLADNLDDLKNRIDIVYNDNFEMGMFSSLQKGLSQCGNADWVLYHFVDQPDLPTEFYYEFIDEIDDTYDWIQPMNEGRKGHPILFSKNCYSTILQTPADSNLRDVSANITKKKYWDCAYKQIFSDIDTQEDYLKIKPTP